MKNNVIPRKAIKIAVTFVRDLMDTPKGIQPLSKKTNGAIGQTANIVILWDI